MPLVEIAALALALAAIFLAWRARREIKTLTAQLDRLQTSLYETRQAQRAQQQEMASRLAALDLSVQKATGELRFDPNLSLAQLYQIEPRAQNVLAAFHIGGCASCAVDENATLSEAVRERGADLDRVLIALNALPANGSAPNLRVPNVQFDP